MRHAVTRLLRGLASIVLPPIQAPAPTTRRFSVVVRRADGVSTYTRSGGVAIDHILEALESTNEACRISVRPLCDGAAA